MNRKKTMVKRRIRMAILMFILIMVGILLIPVSHIRVAASEKSNAQPAYRTYVVKPGDTLWGLADLYMGDDFENHQAYIQDVMRANGMNQAFIYAGQLLMIPYDENVADAQSVAAIELE